MNREELQAKRIELIDQYYYWLEQYHIAKEAIEDIEKEIIAIEDSLDNDNDNNN